MNEERKRFSRAMWITLAIVVLGFWSLFRPLVIRSHRNTDQTEAVSNARRIGLALFEFETEYGCLPDERLRRWSARRPGVGGTSKDRRQTVVSAN